jgi:hypothetical protein
LITVRTKYHGGTYPRADSSSSRARRSRQQPCEFDLLEDLGIPRWCTGNDPFSRRELLEIRIDRAKLVSKLVALELSRRELLLLPRKLGVVRHQAPKQAAQPMLVCIDVGLLVGPRELCRREVLRQPLAIRTRLDETAAHPGELALVRPRLRESIVGTHGDSLPILERYAHVDRRRLQQVLANLIGNALDYRSTCSSQQSPVHDWCDGGRGAVSVSTARAERARFNLTDDQKRAAEEEHKKTSEGVDQAKKAQTPHPRAPGRSRLPIARRIDECR